MKGMVIDMYEQMLHESNCDVVVVGAGPSGISAAIAAARNGTKVILLEEDSLPGGAPVDMYVCMTCGDPRVGIYRELLDFLNENHTIDMEPVIPFHAGMDDNNHWWMPYSYAHTISHFLSQEPNIRLITGVRATSILCKEDSNGQKKVSGVIASHGFGTQPLVIHAKVTIDSTGTGILAEMAGCDVRYGADTKADFGEEYAPDERNNRVMPCTLMYITQRMSGDTMPDFSDFRGGGFVEDKLYNWSSSIYTEALARNKGIYLHWGATVECADTRDDMLLGEAYMQALVQIEHNAKTWYEHGFTVQAAPKIGVRECRRVMGDYVLTIYDMLKGNFEYDTIAVSNYGVDLWGSAKIDEKGLNKKFRTYGIPYRSLLPKHTEGLLIAGKCISGSRFACSSYRVQPIVASIGQACGTAAAISVKDNIQLREVSVTKVQSILQKCGVIDSL
ncbi:FAD-dependent oxidoreductase [Anaerocolumna xylanovorans]|uniref:FAD dependent oxidoreductase n=1 Tax=Anaerocolumna xylanovorans DSM 12503 TaxID=1121345 RepID=A0A1M7Y9M3_9FIRM|nr:FAD-dependent oxidoreductase [Anaerocolumna xylanovorans]SHO49333.1 FAD dependent oxidoreductase [Anaerocolumna xylanovorans DSM 12503]